MGRGKRSVGSYGEPWSVDASDVACGPALKRRVQAAVGDHRVCVTAAGWGAERLDLMRRIARCVNVLALVPDEDLRRVTAEDLREIVAAHLRARDAEVSVGADWAVEGELEAASRGRRLLDLAEAGEMAAVLASAEEGGLP